MLNRSPLKNLLELVIAKLIIDLVLYATHIDMKVLETYRDQPLDKQLYIAAILITIGILSLVAVRAAASLLYTSQIGHWQLKAKKSEKLNAKQLSRSAVKGTDKRS